jgi:hypothetical protein
VAKAFVEQVQQQGLLCAPSDSATMGEQQQVTGWPGYVQQQISSAAGAAGGGLKRKQRELGTFTSFGDLLDWYDTPVEEGGQSRREMEAANDTTWRSGKSNRQRWNERKQLLDCIERRQVEETARQRRAVTPQQAAVLLDADWQAELVLEKAQGARGQPHSSSLSTYHRRHIRPLKLRGSSPNDLDEQPAADQDNQLAAGAGEQQAPAGGEQVMAGGLGPPAAAGARRTAVREHAGAADTDGEPNQQQAGEEDDMLLALAMEFGSSDLLPGGGARSTPAASAAGRPQARRPPRGASPAVAAAAAGAAAGGNSRQRRTAAEEHAALPPVPRRPRTQPSRVPRQQLPQAGTIAEWRGAFPGLAQQYEQEQAAAAQAAAAEAAILQAHQLGSRAAAAPTGPLAGQGAAHLAAATLLGDQQQQTQAAAGSTTGAVQQEAAGVPRRRGRQALPGRLPFNPAARGSAGALTIHGSVEGPNICVQHRGQPAQQEQSDELDVDADMRQQQLAAVGHGA